jgi:hypothetical protein
VRGLGITLAALVAFAGIARADDEALDQARKDVDGSDYDAARTHLQAAIDAGTAGPDELAEIYKLTGIVESALGNTKEATTAYSKWIALDPKAKLPPGTSPKLVRPFDVAHKRPVKLEVKTETKADPPSIALVIGSDPIGIARARVIVSADGKPEQQLEHAGKGRIDIDLPRGKRLDLRVEALDAHGNRVALLGSKDVPIVITGGEDKTAPQPTDVDLLKKDNNKLIVHKTEAPAEPRAWYGRWKTWGVGTIGFAVVTLGAGYLTYTDIQDLKFKNAHSLDYPWSAGQAAEANARRDLYITDVAAGITGALAVGTVILYLARPSEEQLRVGAAPTRGGGAVSIGGSF